MNVSLTPELERGIKAKVATGHYNNASEVIREALREAFQRDQENEWLRREAAIGFAQLEAGQVVRIDSKDQFMSAVRSDS
ncbi:MAG: type II toxin-antitoxin system ParD family antitoxin [Verrucomicrobiota bacterium]|jgi:antitoxin ParD1/3/4